MTGRAGISVVIASYNRPELLRRAVRSVCRQPAFREIVVVDDGSDVPVDLSDVSDSRVTLVRSNRNVGPSAARNLGLGRVSASHAMFLDDDDILLPWAGWAAARWIRADDPARTVHVGGVSVGQPGVRIAFRRPPSSRPGEIWGLDDHILRPGQSFATKQAAVIPVATLRAAGGWDEDLRSRVTSEVFFRLTQIAPVVGHRLPIYHLNRGRHDRITSDPARRLESVAYIRRKHAALLSDPDRQRAFDRNHDYMMRVSADDRGPELRERA